MNFNPGQLPTYESLFPVLINQTTCISVYVLVAIMKKRLKIDLTLYTILQILSVTLFEKIPISQAFSPDSYITKVNTNYNQLKLF